MNSNGTIIKFSEISVTLPFDNESVCLYTNINNNDRLPSIDLNKLISSPIYMYNYLAGYIKEFSISAAHFCIALNKPVSIVVFNLPNAAIASLLPQTQPILNPVIEYGLEKL